MMFVSHLTTYRHNTLVESTVAGWLSAERGSGERGECFISPKKGRKDARVRKDQRIRGGCCTLDLREGLSAEPQ